MTATKIGPSRLSSTSSMDEMRHRIELEALAIAFPLTVALLMFLGQFQMARPGVSWFPITNWFWSYVALLYYLFHGQNCADSERLRAVYRLTSTALALALALLPLISRRTLARFGFSLQDVPVLPLLLIGLAALVALAFFSKRAVSRAYWCDQLGPYCLLWVPVIYILAVVFGAIFGVSALGIKGLAGGREEEMRQRYPNARLIVRNASFFGQESHGVTQARGSGTLAITDSELVFLRWLPRREYKIPIKSITGVETPSSFKAKARSIFILAATIRRS